MLDDLKDIETRRALHEWPRKSKPQKRSDVKFSLCFGFTAREWAQLAPVSADRMRAWLHRGLELLGQHGELPPEYRPRQSLVKYRTLRVDAQTWGAVRRAAQGSDGPRRLMLWVRREDGAL